MKLPTFRRVRNWLLAIMAVLLSVIVGSYWVVSTASRHCFDQLSEVPSKKVGLLLGTSKYRVNGQVNRYYRYRIEAAVRLYRAGKIRYLLISGDNATLSYNEPTTFRADLIEAGIPAERIFLDFAGFRTLDSVVRCKEVFQEGDIVIISQGFHNERAVYIALRKGLSAVGYNARDIGWRAGWKVRLREALARVKTLLDLYVLGTQPRYLGDKIVIS